MVDLFRGSIYAASVTVQDGQIVYIKPTKSTGGPFIIPGFIDAHVHIESSMLVPSEFARLAVTHGTVATVSDPHEIGNVLGVEGVEFMIANSRKVNFKCYFGAPSCVPATPFETAGATINAKDLQYLLSNPDIKYLAEMMNWPGVLHRDPLIMNKIRIAQKLNKPIDGHAPGLIGEQALNYAKAGISTDHECFTLEEAQDKLDAGMHVIIREGSAAKNFDALIPLLPEYCEKVMFCSDDMHPDSLIKGHINLLVQRAVSHGVDPIIALKAACVNPVAHYGLDVGLLRENDPADFLMVNDLKSFEVHKTFISGQLVASNRKSLLKSIPTGCPNNFSIDIKSPQDFEVKSENNKIRVIIAEDGQLVTSERKVSAKSENGCIVSDVDRDILKIVVVNRYHQSPVAISFVQNFGLKQGAIASSVAHDSHNIIAVGVDDKSLCHAVNQIITRKGGVAATSGDRTELLPLPVAGLMSNGDGYQVAEKYMAVDAFAKALGSQLSAPFMTLSFMALLVIPTLKLSDKGLFNGEKFEFVSRFCD